MPLLFDMPLEELERYQGANPRPDDFDAYWDAALAEMKALDPQVELEPAEFQSAIADASTSGSPVWAAHACMPSCCAPSRPANRIRPC